MKLRQPRIKFRTPLYSQTRYTVFLLFCLIITIYSVTYNGVFRVDDEHILAARSQSLALWGRLEEPQVAGNTRVQALSASGDPATQIEPAISLIGAFLYRAGSAFNLGGMQALLTANIYITALSVVAVFLLARLLKFENRTAFWSATSFGLSSMAWPYAMTFYRDSLVMLMAGLVLIGLAIVLYQEQRYKWVGILLIALGIVGGLLSKNSMLAIIPALILGLSFEAWRKAKWKETAIAFGLNLLLLFVVVILLPAKGPFARFSWDYYRDLTSHFLNNIRLSTFTWIAGPFLSPSKSIFLFTPALILIPWALKRSLKKSTGWSITAITFPVFLALAQALFYGEEWAGTFGWGLRFMLPALPGLFGVLAFYFDGSSRRGTPRRLFAALVLVGALIQLSASVTAWIYPYLKLQEMGINPYDSGSAWSLRTLSIPFQLMGLLDLSQWNVAWLRTGAAIPNAILLPLTSLAIITVIILITGMARARRSPFSRMGFAMVFLASTLLPIFLVTVLLKNDPYWEKDMAGYQEGLRLLQAEIDREDIVLVDSYGTPLWKLMMNQWDRPNPWLSLPYEIISPGEKPEPSDPRFDIKSSYLPGGTYSKGSIWYIGSELVPDFLARDELHWFEQNYLECGRWGFERDVFVEVRKFNINTCK